MNAQEWLQEDGSYADGVALLRAAGIDVSRFLPVLQLSYLPPGAKNLLREAIEQLPAPVEARPAKRQVQQEEPPEVLRLRSRGQHLMKLQSDLHTRLKLAKTDTDRYQIAEALMDEVIPELDKVYNAIRSWENNGTLPPDNADDIRRETIALMHKIESLKPRVSRLQGWLKTGKKDGKEITEADRRNYEKELLEKQVELGDIREKLGLDE